MQAIVLGIVQGLTEFLPISSSGHLVLIPEVLGWEPHGLAFDILLHGATLLAVLVYFRTDIVRMVTAVFSRDPVAAADRRLAWLVLVGTVPTVAVALLLGDSFEALFSAPGPVGAFLCVTAVVLIAAEVLTHTASRTPVGLHWKHAALIGLVQGAAIVPGISRSGATIAAGLGMGLSRGQAARFSFLLSIPIILVATLKTGLEALSGTAQLPEPFVSLAGFAAAAVTGYLAIAGLLAYLKNRSLYVFAAYTATVGVAVLIWQYVF